MKAIIKVFTLTLLTGIIAGMTSCEKADLPEVASGSFELSINVPGEQLKSEPPDSSDILTYHVLLSVINSLGETILEDELIPLYKFGNDFVTERIKMKAGRYQLSKFMIINPAGEVEFAAPFEGSPMAYLVKDPLPLAFSILPDDITKVVPEVLTVGNGTPADFGYASFGAHVVRPVPFHIVVVYDDPMLMAPIVPVEAKLRVHSPDGWSQEYFLAPRINRIVIRGGAPYYVMVVEVDGHEPRKLEIPAEKIINTSEDSPMIIRFTRVPHNVLTLQPGPEEGKDAMITDLDPELNFGDHPYFESTFLSEPVLTVMRTTRSLIQFNAADLPKDAKIHRVALTLHYDPAFPWDSIYTDSIYYLGDVNYMDPGSSGFAWFGGVLQQVVEPWAENEVIWSEQPGTIQANQVYITPFLSNGRQINVDVTSLFVPVEEIAAANFGMMLKLWPSEQFPGLRFASSDYPEPQMRPRLQIFYTMPTF